MACVTLKRSLDLEPLYSPPQNSAKRRRCAPLTPLFSRRHQMSGSKRKEHHSQHDLETKRIFGADQSIASANSSPFNPNPVDAFKGSSSSKPSNDEIYSRIRAEWKRLKRRKQVKYLNPSSYRNSSDDVKDLGEGGSSSSSDNDESSSPSLSPRVHSANFGASSSFTSQMVPSSGHSSHPIRNETVAHGDTSATLFTLDQVCMICNKLLVDRESALREEYDKTLREKLSEQYDAFVKFTHDQIQTKFSQSTPSYLS